MKKWQSDKAALRLYEHGKAGRRESNVAILPRVNLSRLLS
jgi:hypothetical protein